MLQLKGGDTSKFDREVGAAFKKLAKGSQVPNTEKVAIDQIMLVCQCENGVDMAYSNPDGFWHPGMMGLWDLHSSDTLSLAKMQLASGRVDANFCPMCLFWSMKNETLNNHVHKHYKMGLTCHSDGFTMASLATFRPTWRLSMVMRENAAPRQRNRKGRAKQHLARRCPSMDSAYSVLQ